MSGPAWGAEGAILAAATDTTAAVPVPPGVVANSIVVVILYRDASGPLAYDPLTVPTGFALPSDNPGVTTITFHSFAHDVIWHRAAGPESGTYDFSWSRSCFRVGVAARLDGCITTGPPFEANDGAASSSASADTPAVSLTTLGADRLLVWSGGSWTGGAWTMPTGFTQRIADVPFDLLTLGTRDQPAAGSSGSLVGTQSTEAHTAWLGSFIAAPAGTTYDLTGAAAAVGCGAGARSLLLGRAGSGTAAGAGSGGVLVAPGEPLHGPARVLAATPAGPRITAARPNPVAQASQ